MISWHIPILLSVVDRHNSKIFLNLNQHALFSKHEYFALFANIDLSAGNYVAAEIRNLIS